jgi:hypothetical protein
MHLRTFDAGPFLHPVDLPRFHNDASGSAGVGVVCLDNRSFVRLPWGGDVYIALNGR